MGSPWESSHEHNKTCRFQVTGGWRSGGGEDEEEEKEVEEKEEEEEKAGSWRFAGSANGQGNGQARKVGAVEAGLGPTRGGTGGEGEWSETENTCPSF